MKMKWKIGEVSLLLAVPIRRALTAQFGQEDNEGENE